MTEVPKSNISSFATDKQVRDQVLKETNPALKMVGLGLAGLSLAVGVDAFFLHPRISFTQRPVTPPLNIIEENPRQACLADGRPLAAELPANAQLLMAEPRFVQWISQRKRDCTLGDVVIEPVSDLITTKDKETRVPISVAPAGWKNLVLGLLKPERKIKASWKITVGKIPETESWFAYCQNEKCEPAFIKNDPEKIVVATGK